MKQRSLFLRLTAVLLFFLVITSQQQVRSSVKNGMELWACHIVPTLFSVIFLAKYWMKLEIPDRILSFLSRTNIPWKNRFYCLPILLLGILCGIPVGGIYLSDLESKKYISSSVASSMLAISSICSLSFLLDYAKTMYIGTSEEWSRIFFSLYLPLPFLYLLILRRVPAYAGKQERFLSFSKSYTKRNPPINECIMETIQTLFVIGGNILFCSVLIAIFYSRLLALPFGAFLLAQIEITTGLELLSKNVAATSLYYDICYLSTLCFGGICAMNQIFSVIQNPHFSKRTYILWKLMHLSSSAVVYLILRLFSQSLPCFWFL